MEWIWNPYGITLNDYLLLWGAMLVILPIALVVGVVKAWRSRK